MIFKTMKLKINNKIYKVEDLQVFIENKSFKLSNAKLFTGIYDVNNNPIFEDDIVEFYYYYKSRGNLIKNMLVKAVVVWHKHGFYFSLLEDPDNYVVPRKRYCREIRVITNED